MAAGWQISSMVAALALLPKNGLSRLAGRFAASRLPQPLQRWQLVAFGRSVGVDFDEVRDPLESFGSLQEFFTRALVPGARPIDPDPRAFVSPCDGAWGAAGKIEGETLLQVKGRPYTLADLLGDAELARDYAGGSFATLYLSPRDYHRFHTPCRVRVAEARYLPGALWPVNRAGVEGVERLFARNERICAHMWVESSAGPQRLCIVAVGALNVGKVRVEFDDLVTNLSGSAGERRLYTDAEPRYEKGEEWGRFEFGSTLVLVAAPGLVALDVEPTGTPVRLGRRIGTLLAS